MTTEVRGALPHEYPEIREILVDAFGNQDDEPEIWDGLVANDPRFSPDCARVTVVDGAPVALTVILPRRVRVRTGWVDGAELTLVGCRTVLQGRGYGGLAVRSGLDFMRSRGMALAMFYGEPGYYPRFGCAPVLPTYRTVLPVGSADESVSPGALAPLRTKGAGLTAPAELVRTLGEQPLVAATEADVPVLAKLYDLGMGVYPGALARTADPWEWRPRSEGIHSIRLLADHSGYAITRVISDRSELYVSEAGVTDSRSARRLLSALISDTLSLGLRQIGASLPPDHLLHRAMALCGGDSLVRQASPGFAVVTDWTRVLPSGYSVTGDILAHVGRPVLKAAIIPLTQLAMGYRDIDDLLLTPECSLIGDDASAALLRRDFPHLYPRYAYSPFYLKF